MGKFRFYGYGLGVSLLGHLNRSVFPLGLFLGTFAYCPYLQEHYVFQQTGQVPATSSESQVSVSWDSPGKNTGVGCHCLLLLQFKTSFWFPWIFRK